jgi:hypothetical protein
MCSRLTHLGALTHTPPPLDPHHQEGHAVVVELSKAEDRQRYHVDPLLRSRDSLLSYLVQRILRLVDIRYQGSARGQVSLIHPEHGTHEAQACETQGEKVLAA